MRGLPVSRWQELEAKYYMTTGRRVPLTIVRGEGQRVWDGEGNVYLDFVGGWAVDTLGHCHQVVTDALQKQGRTLIQTSNQFYTIPQVQLAEVLIENSCMDRIYMGNSGAEANDAAVKLARKHGKLHRNGAYEVITALNSFHGRTFGMVAATGQPHYQENFLPMPEGFLHVPYDDIEAIKAATNDKTCAIMLEPVQGEGGVIVPNEGYLPAVRDWCDEQGLLLIYDEIQTGIGRLGTLFGYQQSGAEPDVMTLAKGMGGGVPIGAILAKEAASVFTPGDHGSTYGGNPLTCAVAFAVVSYVINSHVLNNVRATGERLLAGLGELKKDFGLVSDIRGRGLLQAMEFTRDISGEVLTACLKNGLLVNAVRPNALRFMPPLVVTEAEVDEALHKLRQSLQQVTAAQDQA